jgi:sec-independent protein translocase protein TatC
VVSFIIAAAITPTIDPLNQAIVAGPLIVLYELGVLLARFAGRRSPAPLNAEPASE